MICPEICNNDMEQEHILDLTRKIGCSGSGKGRIGILIQKVTTIGKMSIISGHLCPEKNDDNIVGTHDRQ